MNINLLLKNLNTKMRILNNIDSFYGKQLFWKNSMNDVYDIIYELSESTYINSEISELIHAINRSKRNSMVYILHENIAIILLTYVGKEKYRLYQIINAEKFYGRVNDSCTVIDTPDEYNDLCCNCVLDFEQRQLCANPYFIHDDIDDPLMMASRTYDTQWKYPQTNYDEADMACIPKDMVDKVNLILNYRLDESVPSF